MVIKAHQSHVQETAHELSTMAIWQLVNLPIAIVINKNSHSFATNATDDDETQ